MALRVWLPLNGNLNNQGLSDIGQPTINNLTLQESGKIGKAYRGAALYHLKEDFLQNKWTIAAWVNNNYQWATYNDIILSKNDATSSDAQFYLSIVGGTKLNIGINLHSQQYEYSYTFQTNVWYHVAAAYDGANYYLYLNGDLVKTGADTSSYTTPALNFTINGRSQSSAGSLYSQYKLINDVRVYDECLSQKQIKEISKGLVVHYKLDNFNGTNLVTSLQAGGHTTISNNVVQSDGTDADTYFWLRTPTLTQDKIYTLKMGVSGLPDGGKLKMAINNLDGANYIFYLKNGYNIFTFPCPQLNDFTKMLIDDKQRPPGYGPTKFFGIELIESGGGSVTDCSGNNYNGTIIGTLKYNQDSARYSGSTKFGGTCADYIYRDRFTWLTSPFTFNCWIYQTSATSPSGSNTGNTLQFIMSQGRDCGYAGFALCSANGYARLYLGTATSGTYYSIDDNTINLLNGWHMLTGTFDGATAKLYVDGVQKATKDSAVDPSWEQTTCFALGKMSYNATSSTTTYFPFVGSISDAKIYATALSAEDILTMYKNSGIIDNKGNVYAYEFKEE